MRAQFSSDVKMSNMEHARRVGLREDLIETLLADSEIEDFLPSDEDIGDPPFDLQLENIPSSSSDEATDSEDGRVSTIVATQYLRGSRNRRGRGSRNSRLRGRNRPVQDSSIRNILVPSTSGSTDGWADGNFPPKELIRLEPSYLITNTENFNKIDYFHQYINDDFVNVIVEKTNQTAVKLTGRSLNLDLKECYLYIGISMIMATVNYPNMRMYWEKKWRVEIIAKNMSRNRFIQLRNSLKLVFDDDVTSETRSKDKLWKVRPLIQRMQIGCRSQEKQDKLSIDEMIIPFSGSCGIKQYCPGKPNPVGLKVFVLANPNGLVCDFHVYEGCTTYPQYEESRFGLGEKAVLTLADTLVPGHVLYFDRYFTSEKLVDELYNRGIGCSGTVMKNRIPVAARQVLVDDRALKNRGRGSSQVLVRKDKKVALTKWFDNKAVTLLSSVEADESIDICRRWCKHQKAYVNVDRPRVIRNYNVHMGGVDLADRLLAVCPYRYRTRKWTQRFLSHMIDLSVSNAWIQYKKDQTTRDVPSNKIPQLRSFKMELGEYLLDTYSMPENVEFDDTTVESEPLKRKRGKPAAPLPSKRRRLHAADHMPIFGDKQSRCRHCHYKKTRIVCSTCNIALCFNSDRNCYSDFHSRDSG